MTLRFTGYEKEVSKRTENMDDDDYDDDDGGGGGGGDDNDDDDDKWSRL